AVDLADQFGEGGVQTVLARREVQRPGHLRGGLPAGARVGHRQRRRDAVGREEQVALLARQLAVQVEGEGVVAPYHRGGVRRALAGRLVGSQTRPGGEEQGGEQYGGVAASHVVPPWER